MRAGKALVGVAALAAALTACVPVDKTALIRQATEAACGVLPSVASVVAVSATGAPLAGVAADQVAKAICGVYASRLTVKTLISDCPRVAGMCVWAEKVDLDKLKGYKVE